MTDNLAREGQSLEALLDDAAELKDAIERLEAQLRPLKQSLETLNLTILDRMQADGIDRTRTARVTVSVGEQSFARITAEGRPAFRAWAGEHFDDAFALIGNRLQSEALREFETVYGELPPGTSCYRKPTLNLRRRR